MGIFGDIVSKVFGSLTQGQNSQSAAQPASTSAPVSPPVTDVESLLAKMAQGPHANLNWRESIVDLLKLVGLDSGLEARKTLAQELHYTGDTSDSSTLNVWLHKEVMQKLAQNGGKIPPELGK